MTDHVRGSRCGKRVSNEVPGELLVRAFVECPECIRVSEPIGYRYTPADGGEPMMLDPADVAIVYPAREEPR